MVNWIDHNAICCNGGPIEESWVSYPWTRYWSLWIHRGQDEAIPLCTSAPLSDLLVNPGLSKSKRVFSSGGARTHTTREMKNSSLMLYQLSYQGLMLGEAILLIYILIPIFLIIFHHYLIFLETRPSWKGQ